MSLSASKTLSGLKLEAFVSAMDAVAPLREAEPWDKIGLLVEPTEATVRRVMFCNDLTRKIVRQSVQKKCDMIVAYHPPIFAPLFKVQSQSPVAQAIRAGQGVYSPHTAWDVVKGGSSDLLLDALGPCKQRQPLQRRSQSALGVGRVATLLRPTTVTILARRLKAAAGIKRLLQVGQIRRSVARVAVCPGAGGSFGAELLRRQIDLFVTGELRHHEALALSEAGIGVLCTLHSNSERPSLAVMQQRLQQQAPQLVCLLASDDADPFTVI